MIKSPSEKYYELSQFFCPYFGEDFDLFGDSIEEIVNAYKEDFPPERIDQVCVQIDLLLAEYGAHVEEAYWELGGAIGPAKWGYTFPEFFEELKRLLKS